MPFEKAAELFEEFMGSKLVRGKFRDKIDCMPSLADKLKSLGVKVGTSHLPPSQRASHTIDSVVAGIFHATPRGDTFVAEQTFGEEYLHGKVSPLRQSSHSLDVFSGGQIFPLLLISQWANDPRISALPISKFAFLDTETSGMAGGTGTYAFLVGVARFIDGKFVLQQFFFT